MVTVRIENSYSDGHESKSEVLLPPPEGDLTQWFEDVVYPHTGDGHGIGKDLGSCHVATIIAADDAALLGENCEWTD
jgi:hypothetical protein